MKNIRLDSEYIIIGNDFGTDICINKKEEIVSVDPKHQYPTRFINKNLKCFIKFIIVYLFYEDKIIDASDDKINTVIEEIREKFNEIDIQALSNEENWWSIILEQIELGLM